MSQSLGQNIFRVLNTNSETVGTGFVVADCLAVTCAHVVEAAGSAPGSAISICFYSQTEQQAARVLPEPWSPVSADDLAFLRLPSMPGTTQPLILSSANQSAGRSYQSLGFPKNNKDQARGALDLIVMLVHSAGRQDVLQLKGDEVYFGMSGAPVYVPSMDRVVGMVTKGVDDKYIRFCYATTSDTICRYYPELRLEAPSFDIVLGSVSAGVDHIDKIYGSLHSYLTGGPEPSHYKEYKMTITVEGTDIIGKEHGRITQKITKEDLAKLPPEQLDLIIVFEKSMNNYYKKWKRLYLKRDASPEQIENVRTQQQLDKLVSEMSRDLTGILDFLVTCGFYLDDHYMSIRYIVERHQQEHSKKLSE